MAKSVGGHIPVAYDAYRADLLVKLDPDSQLVIYANSLELLQYHRTVIPIVDLSFRIERFNTAIDVLLQNLQELNKRQLLVHDITNNNYDDNSVTMGDTLSPTYADVKKKHNIVSRILYILHIQYRTFSISR